MKNMDILLCIILIFDIFCANLLIFYHINFFSYKLTLHFFGSRSFLFHPISTGLSQLFTHFTTEKLKFLFHRKVTLPFLTWWQAMYHFLSAHPWSCHNRLVGIFSMYISSTTPILYAQRHNTNVQSTSVKTTVLVGNSLQQ